jgi:fatty acid desaturase
LAALCRPSSWWGAFDLVHDFAAIGTAVAVGVLTADVPGHGVIVAAMVLFIGLCQRRLINLVHELSHRKLFRSAALNRIVGHVIATAMIQSFQTYIDDHRTHHARLGRDGDPKLRSYVARGATTPGRDRWAFVLKVVLANGLWSLPVATVKGWFTKPSDERWLFAAARILSWVVVICVSAVTGTFDTILMYWLVPLAVVLPTVSWLTDLGDHAGLIENEDPIVQTRGWTSHALTRYLLGGHLDDMYHPVHHWCPQIPYRALPAATALVRERYPRFTEVTWCSGFFFRRRSTPDVPSVLEDVVTRLRTTQSSDPVQR